MIALALALASQQPIPMPGPLGPMGSDENACAQLRTIRERTMAEVPQQIDAISQLDGMMVMCGIRTVAFNKSFSVPTSALNTDWQPVTQQRWNAIICDGEAFGPLARRGWRFVQYLAFRSGERIAMDAHC